MLNILILTDKLQYIHRLEQVLFATLGNDVLIKHSDTIHYTSDYPKGHYDLCFIDLSISKQRTITYIYDLKQRFPDSYCIAILLFADDALLLNAFAAGIDGYLRQADSIEKLSKDIQRILSGVPQISSSLARQLLEVFSTASQSKSVAKSYDALTQHELDMLSLIGKGHLVSQSADILSLSVETAQQHIKSVYNKFRSQVGFGDVNAVSD